MKMVKNLNGISFAKQQKRQSEKSLLRLFTVTALSVLSSQTLALNSVPNPGTIAAGTTVTINQGEALGTGYLSIAGVLDNYGVSYDAGLHVLNNGVLKNSGFLAWGVGSNFDQVDSGASIINQRIGVMVFGSLTNGMLDWHGGTMQNYGVVRFLGGNYALDGGEIYNRSGGMIFVDAATSCTETATSTYIQNSGRFEVAPQGKWGIGACKGSHFWNTGGELIVNGQLGVEEFWLNGSRNSVLRGTGIINIPSNGQVWVEGFAVIAPGSSAGYSIGTLTINSGPIFNLRANMDVDITSNSRSDKLIVNGSLSLFGRELNVIANNTNNSLLAKVGDSWNIIRATSLTGTFAKVNLPTLGTGKAWSVQYTATEINLMVVAK